MLRWFRSHGELLRVGSNPPAATARASPATWRCRGSGARSDRPGPGGRRARGKDDALDAIAAAEAARTGRRVQVAKDRAGAVEALRVLRTTRKTAVKCRRATLQQLHNTIVAAPEEVRDQVRNLTRVQRLRTCAAWRPDIVGYRDPVGRHQTRVEIPRPPGPGPQRRNRRTRPAHRPARRGARPQSAAPRRRGRRQRGRADGRRRGESRPATLRSELRDDVRRLSNPASSGKTQRHRLNRGGNRQANSALHMVVVCRMRTDPRTEPTSNAEPARACPKREVMRCLKRYVAREIYRVLTAPPAT